MKTIKTKNAIWFLADNYEPLFAKIAISKLDLEKSIVSKQELITDRMPKQPPESLWLEDEEHENDDNLYVTRKWVYIRDVVWMENL